MMCFESLLTSLLTLHAEVFEEKNKCQQRRLESWISGASEKQSILPALEMKCLQEITVINSFSQTTWSF